MKKFIKKLFTISCVILIMFCISASLSGCILKKYETYDSEYFIYQVSHENGEIFIVGLTDLGKQQKYLIIPETIDGKEVSFISITAFDVYRTQQNYGDIDKINYKSENLEKVFVVSGIGVINSFIAELFSNKEVFYISNDNVEFTNEFYRTSLKGVVDKYPILANISYDYNYVNSSNDGYYWIDNYEYGEKIEFIPPEPTRERYIFDGWYKESECINRWDFGVDTLPQAQYDENEEQVYQETRLYAKWIEIGG